MFELDYKMHLLKEENLLLEFLKISNQTADIDLFFKKEDIPKAHKILMQESGFNELKLDLHWYIEQFLDLDIRDIWTRSDLVWFEGQKVLVLSPEDLIIHLCIHLAFHHNFQLHGLRSLYDIKVAVEYYNEKINWDEIISRSNNRSVKNAVHLSLLLAKELLDAQIPDLILQKLSSALSVADKYDWAISQIFDSPKETIFLSPYFWQLLSKGNLKRKIGFLKKLMFPDSKFIIQENLSAGKEQHVFFQYFDRLKYYYSKYLKAMFLILIRDSQMKMSIKRQKKIQYMKKWLTSGQAPQNQD